MADENVDKKIALYFIGTALVAMNRLVRPPIYSVKGRVYEAPSHLEDGKLVLELGTPIMVYERDVDELMFKSRMNTKAGLVQCFTRDANIAAGVKNAWEQKHELRRVPVEMDVNAAAALATPELLRERALAEFTADELRAMLAERESMEEPLRPTPPQGEPPVVDDPEMTVEDAPSAAKSPKNKPTPPPVRAADSGE